MGDRAYVAMAAFLIALGGIMVGFVGGRLAPRHDGLVAVTRMDYTNTYPTFTIRCTHRGSRTDFQDDGSDIAPGDRLVRDCQVVGR